MRERSLLSLQPDRRQWPGLSARRRDDQANVNPLLVALANNGGPTRTHLPMTGSPAIDRGDPTACPRRSAGIPRPLDGDMNGSFTCDVGSVELPEPRMPAQSHGRGLALAALARSRKGRAASRARNGCVTVERRRSRRICPRMTFMATPAGGRGQRVAVQNVHVLTRLALSRSGDSWARSCGFKKRRCSRVALAARNCRAFLNNGLALCPRLMFN